MPTKKSPKSSATKAAKASKSPAIEKPKAATRKKRTPGKASAKLTPSFTLEKKSPAVEPLIPHEDISLRAYYIGERRQKMGWPGDSGTDWADALSQLRAEALEKPLKKR
jgi:hypothetical protein